MQKASRRELCDCLIADLGTVTLTPADNPIVGTGAAYERHLLVIEYTWNAGASKAHENIYLTLVNDEKVPT